MTSPQKSSLPWSLEEIQQGIESPGGVFHPHMILVQDFSTYGLIVDLRSAEAYAHDHIPDAVNVAMAEPSTDVGLRTGDPLQSATVVNERAPLVDVPSTLNALVDSLPADESILLYCGTGGLVSQPLAAALRWRGRIVDVLPGGWRNYRDWVVAGLMVVPRLLQWRVLSTPLGGEARRVFDALLKIGHQVIDIEGLAGWRQGVVGAPESIPTDQPSQAWFDSQLLHAMRWTFGTRPVWVADVGAQLGALQVPVELQRALAIAPMAQIEMPLSARVAAWREDELVLTADDAEGVLDALSASTPRPPARLLARWRGLAEGGQIESLLMSALSDHVDARFRLQAAERQSRRHVLPPLVLASLAPEELDAAVRRWLPVPYADDEDADDADGD